MIEKEQYFIVSLQLTVKLCGCILIATVFLSASVNKRIRRSDEELRRAAECITRGQTFQTVSDQFNIPISTIRFYMARKVSHLNIQLNVLNNLTNREYFRDVNEVGLAPPQ